MSTIDDGGPAFPESYVGLDRPHEGIGGGMSLRAHFAGEAMKGLLSHHGLLGSETEISYWSVRHADALIAALKEDTDAAR